MLHPSDAHVGSGVPRAAAGIEDLGAGHLAAGSASVAAHHQHPSVIEERGGMRIAGRAHGGAGRPGVRDRVVDLGLGVRGVLAATGDVHPSGHEHTAIPQHSGRVTPSRSGHGRHRDPAVERREVTVGAPVAALSAGHQHAAVAEEGGGGPVAGGVHRGGRGDPSGRIEQGGAGEHAVARVVQATGNENPAVPEPDGHMPIAPTDVTHCVVPVTDRRRLRSDGRKWQRQHGGENQ